MSINLLVDEVNGLLDKTPTFKLSDLETEMTTATDTDRELLDTLYTKLYDIFYTNYDDIRLTDDIIKQVADKHQLYSFQIATDYDSFVLKTYVNRLSSENKFTAHVSVKLNGWFVRVIYTNGEFYKAFTKNGRDLTEQLRVILENSDCLILEDLEDLDIVEIQGELVISKNNLQTVRDTVGTNLASTYTGVALLCNTDNECNEWSLLNFVAFGFVCDGFTLSTKTEEYQYLDELGFDTPIYWNIEELNKDNLLTELTSIVADCELEVRATDIQEGYPYATDGLVFTLDDNNYFNKMGKSLNKYQYGNVVLKIGYWKQETYKGYIQTILWKQNLNSLEPYAIIANKPHIIEYDDLGDYDYIMDEDNITNKKDLGIIINDKKVWKVPLYSPSNILRLDAFVDTELCFIYHNILGIIPCFEDGRILLDGIVKRACNGEFKIDKN